MSVIRTGVRILAGLIGAHQGSSKRFNSLSKTVATGLLAAMTATGAHAGTLPVPYWSMQTVVSSEDGYANLQWAVRGGDPVSFFRLTEEFQGNSAVHFVDHPTTRLYRIEPGLYEFRVQACERDSAGYPSCGAKSPPLALTVTAAAGKRETGPPPVGKSPPGPTRSPSGFTPGRWHNPDLEGHGWSFIWKSRLSHPEEHPQYGDAWDLLGTWYTYEAKLKYAQDPDQCPGPACVWIYDDYKPVHARMWLTRTGSQRYSGSVYITRSNIVYNVGSVAVNFATPASAELHWGASFLWQSLTGSEDIELLVAPDSDPIDNPAHYSGLWEPSFGGSYLVAHALGYTSESVEVVFEDENGDPSWIMAAGDDPLPGHTDLCFFYVENGFPPGTTSNLTFYENGCDADLPAGSANRNGYRRFTGFEDENFWVDFELPGGTAPDRFTAGTAATPDSLEKSAGFHRVSYQSGEGSQCQLSAGTPLCTVNLTWFTDGNFPDTSVFAHDAASGVRLWVDTAMVMEDFEWCLDQAGEWTFELRMGETPDSTLMGMSDVFHVSGQSGAGCDGAGPEVPPAPVPPPNMTPSAESSRTGATVGEFTVSATGGAQYRIPILAAPGSGGLAPAVALAYDSQSGNGPVGVGWGIDGVSIISRCAQTIEQDADPQSRRITFTTLDRFCLDGERLMAIDGAYGAHGTEYRKERDDYTRIISYGGGVDGPDHFKAWTRDGVLLEFGRSKNSRIEARADGFGQTAYTWAQNRLEDTAGNYIEYVYLENASGPVDYVLHEIRYTGNTAAGTQPYAEMRFAYDEERADTQTAFTAGVATAHSRLLQRIDSLSRIDAAAPLEHLRSYHLTYGVDGWGRAVLERLTECRDPTATMCFEPTEFTWHKSEHQVSGSGPDASSHFTSDFRGLAVTDTSGDGRPDLLITERTDQGFEFAIARGSAGGGFSKDPQRFPVPEGADPGRPVPLTVIDLNADGYQDVLFVRETAGEVSWHARLAGPTGMGEEIVVLDDCCGLLAPALLQVLDFNGDGLSDVLTHRPVREFEVASEIVVLINDFQPGDTQPGFQQPLVIDVNYPDLFPSTTANGWQVSDEAPVFGFQGGRHLPGRVDDFYGDGSVDILVRLSRLYRQCSRRACPPDGPSDGSSPAHPVFVITDGEEPLRAPAPGPDPLERWAYATFYLVFFADQDGDYSTYEIIARGAGDDCGVPDVCNPYFALPDAKRSVPADINADGLADVAYLDENFDWHYRLNSGAGFLPAEHIGSPPDDERAERARFIDITGDTYPEMLYPNRLGDDSAVWMVQFNQLGQGFSVPLTSSMPVGNTVQGDFDVMLDFTADGIVDQLFVDWRGDGNGAQAGTTRLRRGINLVTGQAGQAFNSIAAIEDGYGARREIAYAPLTDPDAHSRMNDSANADWGRGSVIYDLTVPFPIVTSVESSAPVYGAPNQTGQQLYHYAGAKLQAGGRGFLGFAEIVEFDPEKNLRINTRYRQDFPFTGLIADQTKFISNLQYNSDLITDISQLHPISWPSLGAETALPPHSAHGIVVRSSIREYDTIETSDGNASRAIRSPADLSRDFGLDGQLRHKVLTTRIFDEYDNVLLGTEFRYANETGGHWSRTSTQNQWINDVARWRLGRLGSTEVSHWRADGGAEIERRSDYDYHSGSSLLTGEIVQPGHPGLQVTTEYTLDAFGNRTSVSVTGAGMIPRTSTFAFDALGRFGVEARNAYGQVTQLATDWDVFGNPLETRGIDGVADFTASDHMGRPFARYRETGRWSRTDLGSGAHPQCPSGTSHYSLETGGGAARRVTCFDRLHRGIRQAREGFLGGWIYTDSYFDVAGRPERVSEPYFAGQSRHWNLTEFDDLDRPVRTTAANGLVETTEYGDQGVHCGQTGARAVLTTSLPGDGTARRLWTMKNVAGESERVIDDNCGEVRYAYDAVGNLVEVAGIDGAVTAIGYDNLGFHKVEMNDPDRGFWQYASNALGEVTRQLDSKQQAIDFEYDLLGRMTHRRELSGVSSLVDQSYQTENHEIHEWQNSTAAGLTGRGQLMSERYLQGEAGALVHQRSYGYDDFGRVAQVDHLLDGQSFVERTTYDQHGRVFQQFDGSGDSRGIRYHYNTRGYFVKLREAREGEQGTVYQDVLAMDPHGNATAMVLGNQVELFADFDPASGLVQSLEAYDADGGEMQFLEYGFDRLGNLAWRHDRSGSNDLREAFDYDHLSRLERVMLTAPQLGLSQFETQSLTYDATGNLTFKSGVGGYSYGQGTAGPHAVTQAGGIAFSYDPNGNQVSSSDGRSVAYSVFDKPTQITRGPEQTEFSYGLGNRRYKRTDDNKVDGQRTTLTIGNVELITQAGAEPYFKRYLGGVAIVDHYPSSGVTVPWYVARDHLGSIHTVSDADGHKVQENHFDPWGRRRAGDWQAPLGAAGAALANQFTTRGFTGHEHADGLGVIHMNGRIYDPRLGRFLQADPFVQAPGNGQNLNRYSYALNNPLSYTDPSGYFLKRLIRKWGRVIVAALVSYYLPGSQGWLSTYLGVSSSFAQAVITGAVAGGVTGGLRGAAKGAFFAAVTWGADRVFNSFSGKHIELDKTRLAPDASDMERLFGPGVQPESGLFRISVGPDGEFKDAIRISAGRLESGDWIFTNGASNGFADAVRNGTTHVAQLHGAARAYVLNFNQTSMLGLDLIQTSRDILGTYLGAGHTGLARELAQTVSISSENGVRGLRLIGHSQGGAITTSALRYAADTGLRLDSVASINLHGAPINNLYAARRLGGRIGAAISNRSQFADAVNAIAGANFIANPLRLPFALVRFPHLFSSDSSLSPHTTPCGSRLQLCR